MMKNVAGYDVSRLLAGSLGALGALIEVSLKVVPRPRCEATVALELDVAAALRACSRWRVTPTPVSATAWIPAGAAGAGALYARLSGNDSAVRQGVARIGGPTVPAADAGALWTSLRDRTHAFSRGGRCGA
jgi:glycolate oxidase FAD binding subunit